MELLMLSACLHNNCISQFCIRCRDTVLVGGKSETDHTGRGGEGRDHVFHVRNMMKSWFTRQSRVLDCRDTTNMLTVLELSERFLYFSTQHSGATRSNYDYIIMIASALKKIRWIQQSRPPSFPCRSRPDTWEKSVKLLYTVQWRLSCLSWVFYRLTLLLPQSHSFIRN